MTPGRKWAIWVGAAFALTAIVFAGLIGLVILANGAIAEHVRGSPGVPAVIAFAALAATVGTGVLALVVWSRLLRPGAALAAETKFIAETGRDGAIDPARFPWLAALTAAVNALAERHAAARREIDRQVAAATDRVEEQKQRLEAILRDLSEGVLVCNMDHQILLYNQVALSLLHVAGELGLGRSLFNVVTREPVLHALERLINRPLAEARSEDAAIAVVCATIDARALLRGRMSLVVDADGTPSGYVLTLNDVTREVAELGRRDALLRAATVELRGPLANLRAAAETISSYSDMDVTQRRSFEDVIRRESDVLSARVEQLDRDYRTLTSGDWPMADVHSTDLFNCVSRRLTDAGGPQLVMVGLPLWLRGDSHSLMLAIERLAHEIAAATRAMSLDIEALLGDRRVYVELRWDGAPLSSAVLDGWLGGALPGALAAQTLGEVLARHGSEIWSRAIGESRALLRLPLPAPARFQFTPPQLDLPARPEFYDFSLLRPASADRHTLTRPLRSFSFVVFDTETTGLRPSEGDEIVSIGAVRIVNGRILTGETFARLVNPGRVIPPESMRFHGITDKMVADAPPVQIVLPQFRAFLGNSILVAHNAAFDMKFLRLRQAECGVAFDGVVLDTLLISAFLHPDMEGHDLDTIVARLGIEVPGRHSALGDALATGAVFVRQLDLLEARGIVSLESLLKASNITLELRARQAQF